MAQLLTVAAQLEVWRPMCGAPGLVGSGLGVCTSCPARRALRGWSLAVKNPLHGVKALPALPKYPKLCGFAVAVIVSAVSAVSAMRYATQPSRPTNVKHRHWGMDSMTRDETMAVTHETMRL